MKLIIGGSRTVDPSDDEIVRALDGFLEMSQIEVVVCGMAKTGADPAGKRWADSNSIPVEECPVTKEDYQQHGSYLAPKFRNRRMAEIGHAAIIFWDGTSGGSADMVTRMVARGKPVKVVPTRKRPKPDKAG